MAKETKNPKGRPSSKEEILQATERVVLKQGAGNLTLDAVVKESGVSKGGLLYHFPNKDALLMAMLDRFVFTYRDFVGSSFQEIPEGKNGYLKAYILSMAKENKEIEAMANSILAFIVNNPEKGEYLKSHFEDDWEDVKNMSSDIKTAMLVNFAFYGLALLETLKLSPLSSEERKQFTDLLYDLADRGLDEIL